MFNFIERNGNKTGIVRIKVTIRRLLVTIVTVGKQ